MKNIIKLISVSLISLLVAFSSANASSGVFKLSHDLGFGKVMKPVRLAICGNLNGPSLFEIMGVLGKEITLSRLRMALNNF